MLNSSLTTFSNTPALIIPYLIVLTILAWQDWKDLEVSLWIGVIGLAFGTINIIFWQHFITAIIFMSTLLVFEKIKNKTYLANIDKAFLTINVSLFPLTDIPLLLLTSGGLGCLFYWHLKTTKIPMLTVTFLSLVIMFIYQILNITYQTPS